MTGAASSPTDWAPWLVAYAAAVSTFVALRQMFLEQPSVRVVFYPDQETVPEYPPISAVVVTNTGGRPITIDFVAVLFPDRRVMGAPLQSWREKIPFRLGEGDYKVLEVPPEDDIPSNAKFIARDTANRWWPRRRRPRVWWDKLRWGWSKRTGRPLKLP